MSPRLHGVVEYRFVSADYQDTRRWERVTPGVTRAFAAPDLVRRLRRFYGVKESDLDAPLMMSADIDAFAYELEVAARIFEDTARRGDHLVLGDGPARPMHPLDAPCTCAERARRARECCRSPERPMFVKIWIVDDLVDEEARGPLSSEGPDPMTDDDFGGEQDEMTAAAVIRRLGVEISRDMPPGGVFMLWLQVDKVSSYVSNGDRAEMAEALREFAEHLATSPEDRTPLQEARAAPLVPTELRAALEELLANGQVHIAEARDAGDPVVLPRALVRRLVGSLRYALGMNQDLAARDDDALLTRTARFYQNAFEDQARRLTAAAAIDDHEDLDD